MKISNFSLNSKKLEAIKTQKLTSIMMRTSLDAIKNRNLVLLIDKYLDKLKKSAYLTLVRIQKGAHKLQTKSLHPKFTGPNCMLSLF